MDKQVLVYSCEIKSTVSSCRNEVSVPNEYNIRRHFETQHPNIAELDANEKKL